MLLAPELFETDAADKYFISARINHRGQRNFPLALLFLNTASVKTLLRNSIFVRYLKCLSAHDTHPPEVQAAAGVPAAQTLQCSFSGFCHAIR